MGKCINHAHYSSLSIESVKGELEAVLKLVEKGGKEKKMY